MTSAVGTSRFSVLAWQSRAAKPYFKLGFYGCRDQIVRMAFDQAIERYPSKLTIHCPACDNEHDVNPMWRTATKFDEGKQPGLLLAVGDTLEPAVGSDNQRAR